MDSAKKGGVSKEPISYEMLGLDMKTFHGGRAPIQAPYLLPKENLCMLKKEMPSLADSAARVTRPTDWDRILAVPQVKHRIANIARIREVDNFYKLCQLHREQYSGGACYAEPIKFFKTTSHGESQTSLTRFCPMKHPIAYPLNYAVTSGVPGPSVLSLSSRRS